MISRIYVLDYNVPGDKQTELLTDKMFFGSNVIRLTVIGQYVLDNMLFG